MVDARAMLVVPDVLELWRRKMLPGGGRIVCFPSVSTAWTEEKLGAPLAPSGRVRALNCFPSCDRLVVLPDGRLRFDHLVTTSLGGCIPDLAVNWCMGGTLVKAYVHEAEMLRKYVLAQAVQRGCA